MASTGPNFDFLDRGEKNGFTKYVIYQWTNKSGLTYIGQAVNGHNRTVEHFENIFVDKKLDGCYSVAINSLIQDLSIKFWTPDQDFGIPLQDFKRWLDNNNIYPNNRQDGQSFSQINDVYIDMQLAELYHILAATYNGVELTNKQMGTQQRQGATGIGISAFYVKQSDGSFMQLLDRRTPPAVALSVLDSDLSKVLDFFKLGVELEGCLFRKDSEFIPEVKRLLSITTKSKPRYDAKEFEGYQDVDFGTFLAGKIGTAVADVFWETINKNPIPKKLGNNLKNKLKRRIGDVISAFINPRVKWINSLIKNKYQDVIDGNVFSIQDKKRNLPIVNYISSIISKWYNTFIPQLDTATQVLTKENILKHIRKVITEDRRTAGKRPALQEKQIYNYIIEKIARNMSALSPDALGTQNLDSHKITTTSLSIFIGDQFKLQPALARKPEETFSTFIKQHPISRAIDLKENVKMEHSARVFHRLFLQVHAENTPITVKSAEEEDNESNEYFFRFAKPFAGTEYANVASHAAVWNTDGAGGDLGSRHTLRRLMKNKYTSKKASAYISNWEPFYNGMVAYYFTHHWRRRIEEIHPKQDTGKSYFLVDVRQDYDPQVGAAQLIIATGKQKTADNLRDSVAVFANGEKSLSVY